MSYDTVAVRYPNIGVKLTCVSCSTRFYDLARIPAVCPKCGVEQPPELARVRTPRRGAPVLRRPAKPAAAAEGEDDAVPLVEADDEDAVIEDEEDDEAEAEAEAEDDPALEEVAE